MGEDVKKIILTIVLFLGFTGVATGSSLNGDYNGNPIVLVKVNGVNIGSDVPAQVINGTTLLPLRSVAQALGATVDWDQNAYSVDVKMTSQLAVESTKQYTIDADFCVYLEHSSQYISGFSTSLDAYSKGIISDNQIYAEYLKNVNKTNEVSQKAVEVSNKSSIYSWGNINTYLKELYAINDLLVDAYKDDVAYRMALSQGQPSDVSNGLLNSYSGKAKSATDRTMKLIDGIRAEYSSDIDKAIK